MPTLNLYKTIPDQPGWDYYIFWTGTEIMNMSTEDIRQNDESFAEAHPEIIAERERWKREDEEFLRSEEADRQAAPMTTCKKDRKHRVSIVYFIGPENGSSIKIGYSERPIKERLRHLQTGSPYPLKVFLTTPGTLRTEREFHERFSSLRIRGTGEWFLAEGELIEFLRSPVHNKDACSV